ncbi:hypothetical protein FRX31_005133, partial [Thalictrum thalictroides]
MGCTKIMEIWKSLTRGCNDATQLIQSQQTTGDRPWLFSVEADTIWVNLENLTLRNEVIFQGANFSTKKLGCSARPGLISSLLICNKKIANNSNSRGRGSKVLNCSNSAQNRSNGHWQWQGAN